MVWFLLATLIAITLPGPAEPSSPDDEREYASLQKAN
jgi:hypothetical protein